jgi:hypothetical protein
MTSLTIETARFARHQRPKHHRKAAAQTRSLSHTERGASRRDHGRSLGRPLLFLIAGCLASQTRRGAAMLPEILCWPAPRSFLPPVSDWRGGFPAPQLVPVGRRRPRRVDFLCGWPDAGQSFAHGSSASCRGWTSVVPDACRTGWLWFSIFLRFAGKAGVPCRCHPLGCVRFRPDAARFKPRSARGEAPAVRTAPGRCAPAPLPSSGLSAPGFARPRKPHPRGRTPAQCRRDLPGRAKGSRS